MSFRSGINIIDYVPLRAAVENVFDHYYKYTGSATYSAGRQYVMSLAYEF